MGWHCARVEKQRALWVAVAFVFQQIAELAPTQINFLLSEDALRLLVLQGIGLVRKAVEPRAGEAHDSFAMPCSVSWFGDNHSTYERVLSFAAHNG